MYAVPLQRKRVSKNRKAQSLQEFTANLDFVPCKEFQLLLIAKGEVETKRNHTLKVHLTIFTTCILLWEKGLLRSP